jgi:hypothetical protein
VTEQIASADLQALIEARRADPASDDIAVLDVWLRGVEPAGPGGESAEPVAAATPGTVADADASDGAAAADASADAADDAETVVLPRMPSTARPVPARPAPGGLPLRLVVLLVAGVAVLAVAVVLVAVWLAFVTAPSLAPAGPPG